MSLPTATPPWRDGYADLCGLRFHYVEAGSGPLVLLLHGFPEFWYCWRRQIPALASAGLHAVAPDLRGYNETDKPAGVRNYRLSVLAEDIARLIAHCGEKQAVIVGHDWGGAIAWRLAIDRPELVRKLIILNAPHPAAFQRELRKPAQWLRSLYIALFQLPWLPERMLRARNLRFLDDLFKNEPVLPFSSEDIERYREAFARPGALTAALNYYRAAFRDGRESMRADNKIMAPTLLIWGERDRYIGLGATDGLDRWVNEVRVERLPHATHWVHHDAPDAVNRLMIEFCLLGPKRL